MTVRLGLLFFSPSIPLPLLLYYEHPPFAPCNGLELDLLSDTKTGTRRLVDCAPFPYLLHALPSPLLYYLRVHQYLLMCTLCALFVPASPHHRLMYHCTFCARFLTP